LAEITKASLLLAIIVVAETSEGLLYNTESIDFAGTLWLGTLNAVSLILALLVLATALLTVRGLPEAIKFRSSIITVIASVGRRLGLIINRSPPTA